MPADLAATLVLLLLPLVGTTCFAAGFFGPMILAPRANQGPLLGLFYTGPLGLAGRVVWGLLRARRRRAA